nr:transposase [Photobacterium marinum]
MWLMLQHVLPKGMQRVRDYGFLRGTQGNCASRSSCYFYLGYISPRQ